MEENQQIKDTIEEILDEITFQEWDNAGQPYTSIEGRQEAADKLFKYIKSLLKSK